MVRDSLGCAWAARRTLSKQLGPDDHETELEGRHEFQKVFNFRESSLCSVTGAPLDRPGQLLRVADYLLSHALHVDPSCHSRTRMPANASSSSRKTRQMHIKVSRPLVTVLRLRLTLTRALDCIIMPPHEARRHLCDVFSPLAKWVLRCSMLRSGIAPLRQL